MAKTLYEVCMTHTGADSLSASNHASKSRLHQLQPKSFYPPPLPSLAAVMGSLGNALGPSP